MLEVSRHGGKTNPVNLSQVARLTGISKKFLEQLAIALKSHSLLRGVCGRQGGYLLGRPADRITIGEVLTAVSGPTNLTFCVENPDTCMSSEFCECRLIWQLLSLRVKEVLNEFTIADLLNTERVDFIREEIRHTAAGKTSRQST